MKACRKLPDLLIVLSLLIFSAVPAAATDNRPIVAKRGPDKQLTLNLMTLDTGNIESLADEMYVFYNNGYLLSTSDDVLKVANIGENIAS